MGIQYPIVAEIAYKTWCINEFGMDAMFLLEGDENALLIDTGTGTFSLTELLSTLTDKPVIVVLTHGHIDHAGGIKQFDTVYLHESDFEMAKTIAVHERQQYADMLIQMSQGIFTQVECKEFTKEPDFVSLKEGQDIDLGNRVIKVYETSGHTEGGLSFLDTKERILFSGDACNPNILLLDTKEKNGIKNVLESAKKLDSLQPYFDRHYNGHIGYAGYIAFYPLPKSLIKDTIELCENILSSKVVGEPTSNPFGGSCLIAKNKTMQIQYKEENIR